MCWFLFVMRWFLFVLRRFLFVMRWFLFVLGDLDMEFKVNRAATQGFPHSLVVAVVLPPRRCDRSDGLATGRDPLLDQGPVPPHEGTELYWPGIPAAVREAVNVASRAAEHCSHSLDIE
jgi:hypothetical protein